MAERNERGFEALMTVYENSIEEQGLSCEGALHVRDMCGLVRNMLDHNRTTGKVHRWIGFVQGWLWTENIFTLDELQEQTAAALEDEHRVLLEILPC